MLAYFGLDGSASASDWAHSAVEVVPPVLVAAIAARLDGVGGLVGWVLSVVYLVAASAAWWILIMRLAPWRRT
jgi:uncharacterized membrane protein YecN with MAPEG domain